jgi:hypothetical protein
MQQQWEAFWESVTVAAHHALSPFRASAETFGYHPTDMQIWCFLCALFISAIVTPYTYGDFVLRRRRAFATGKVVKIDTSGDAPYTPTIEFRDASGNLRRFDSNLQVNGGTGTVGAAVAVIYDPVNPARAREIGRPLAKAFNTIFWYCLIAALFGFAFFYE